MIEMDKKKRLLLALCFIVIGCICFAQDIIVTKDAKRINAKVAEVNVDNVRYVNFDYQDGPVYTLLKRDIAAILYQNGQAETFDAANNSSTTRETPTTTTTAKDVVTGVVLPTASTGNNTSTTATTSKTTGTSSTARITTTPSKEEVAVVKNDNPSANNVCPGCKGKGTVNCGGCGGLGQTFNFFSASYVTCSFCQGSGQYYCFCQTGGIIGVPVRAGGIPVGTGGAGGIGSTGGTGTSSTKIQCTRCKGTGLCNSCGGSGKGTSCGYCSSSSRPGQVFKQGSYGGDPYWQTCPYCTGGRTACTTCSLRNSSVAPGKCIGCNGLGWL